MPRPTGSFFRNASRLQPNQRTRKSMTADLAFLASNCSLASGMYAYNSLAKVEESIDFSSAVQLLWENGFDIKVTYFNANKALFWAAANGHEAVARLLLEKGADVAAREDDGWTALHGAARYGHEAVARLLLEKGADVAARDDVGWTALHGAAEYGHEAVARLLLEKGAD